MNTKKSSLYHLFWGSACWWDYTLPALTGLSLRGPARGPSLAVAVDQRQAHTDIRIDSFIHSFSDFTPNLALSILSTPSTSSGLYLCLSSRAIINPPSVLGCLVHYVSSKASFCQEVSSNTHIRFCLHLFFAGGFRALLRPAEDNWVLQPETVHTDFQGGRWLLCSYLLTSKSSSGGACLSVVDLIRPTVLQH